MFKRCLQAAIIVCAPASGNTASAELCRGILPPPALGGGGGGGGGGGVVVFISLVGGRLAAGPPVRRGLLGLCRLCLVHPSLAP